MKSKTSAVPISAGGLTLILGRVAWAVFKREAASIEPPPDSEVEMTATEKGTTYKLVKGNLYRVSSGTGKWGFVKPLYDPDFYAKNSTERNGTIFRRAGKGGELVPVRRSFADDFEGAERLADLIGPKRGWSTIELQSPQAPSVKDYVKLRQLILKGELDFLDNRIEPSGELVPGRAPGRSMKPPRPAVMKLARYGKKAAG